MSDWVVVKKSAIHGKGGFATKAIRKGVHVIEYAGERISYEEALQRHIDTEKKQRPTYLFALSKSVVVDAAVGGNDARFINHSCDPNCEAKLWHDGIWITALRTIEPGEEITYDYQLVLDGTISERQAKKLYPCHCQTTNCTGLMVKLVKTTAKTTSTKKKVTKK